VSGKVGPEGSTFLIQVTHNMLSSPFTDIETIGTMFQPLSVAIDAKLGRCQRCIRLSIGWTVVCLSVLVLLIIVGAQRQLVLMVSVPAAAFSALSIAHGAAYVLRRPAAAKRCTPCEARRKTEREGGLKQGFSRRTPAPGVTSQIFRSCATCGKSKSPAELIATADQLPRADQRLLKVVESSEPYRSLMEKMASLSPIDDWQANQNNHFVYRLKDDAYGEGASVLFVAAWPTHELISAMVVVPSDPEPLLIDVRNDERAMTINAVV